MNSVKVPWQHTKAGDLDLEVLALEGCEFKMRERERERGISRNRFRRPKQTHSLLLLVLKYKEPLL